MEWEGVIAMVLIATLLVVAMLTDQFDCNGCTDSNYRFYRNRCLQECAPTWRTAEQCQELCK